MSAPTFILATDLDGTFLGGSDEERRALYRMLEERRDRVLIFVTGRDLGFIRGLVEEGSVPRPDYIVGDVGTTIADGVRFLPVEALETDIREAWGDAGPRMEELLANEPGLRRQPTEFRYRLSYFYEPSLLSPETRHKIEDAGFDCLLSAETYLDVLPRGVSKGPTLLKLLRALGLPQDRVLVAGDTLNDLSLFQTGLKGVAVGNSEPKLMEVIAGLDRVYRARRHGAGGIFDALEHFELLAQPTPREEVLMKKSSLVIVYHRQPYEEVLEGGKTVYRENKSPNGIVPTLKSFFGRIETGRGAWVAWKQITAKKQRFEKVIEIEDSYGRYHVSRLPLTAEQVKSFYHVTSKEALWPVLHSFPWLFQYDNVDWATFREVNRLFAEAAAEQAEDDALIWVHDYNLWLVPTYLRKLKPNARIAFFHHTPFPAPDVFNILPWREEIVDSLLVCDLVGLHVPSYARNFCDVARVLRDAKVEKTVRVDRSMSPVGMALSEPEVPVQLRANGRTIGIDSFPVGTNPQLIDKCLEKDENRAFQAQIEQELTGRKLIVAVGRTDYTKGMQESLRAFERLLTRQPELHGKVQLMLTSVRAASEVDVYRDTQHAIEGLVGRINGRFGTLGWTPVVFFTNAVPFERLLAYYRSADVCLTTPLRDGLNLVAKEFVAAKHGAEKPGVLVLSEFTGCAVELPSAVLTNPYSNRDLDRALDLALGMSAEEAQARMEAMGATVRSRDVGHWVDHTLDRFAEVGAARRTPPDVVKVA
jgi:glucosylglycerol-phosphate synthase